MILQTLLERMEYCCVQGSTDIEVTSLVYDSRRAQKGSVFVCIKGAVVDGHTFVSQVCEAGVSAVIVQDDVTVPEAVTVIKVADTRLALAELSAILWSAGSPICALTARSCFDRFCFPLSSI